MINTRFWIDDYISNLDPIEKLLFLYLLTNPYTDICGVYEIPTKHIALETGIDKEMVLKILRRFESEHKVYYENGWVAIVNFAKHQLKNPKVEKGIEIGLSKAPKSLIDRLQIDYDTLSHSNLNSNSNLNSKNMEDKSSIPSKGKKEKRLDSPIVWSEYLKSMENDERPIHIQLMGYFFQRRGLKFDTKFEVEEAISRHSKYAVKVAKFGKDKVFKAMDECDKMDREKGIKWTLETVWKQLTK